MREIGNDPSYPSKVKGVASRTYDKDLINRSLYGVLAYYATGSARTVGVRTTYTCPECHKPKLDASSVHMKAGCWNASCPVPNFTDALGLITYFESLDPTREFRTVLAKGYEILGLDGEEASARVRPQGPGVRPAWRALPPPDANRRPEEASAPKEAMPESRSGEELEKLCDAVYKRVPHYCKLEERDVGFWRSRGLNDETIRRGGLGSISFTRARALKATLLDEFGSTDLLAVQGFSAKKSGEPRFTLTGDYTLIPYYDASGRIATLEGRWTGKGPPPREMGKYVSLSGAGNHLYLFPGCEPDEIQAFCEGPVGAMVAAQSGVAVGAIQGFRRYRSSSGSVHDGESGEPLAELGGVDFSGRTIAYIPDVDDPPRPEVLEAAPEAARWLVERQGGRPALLGLPEGKDLDEWLLLYEPHERRERLLELLSRATPLSSETSQSVSVNTVVRPEGSAATVVGIREGVSGKPSDGLLRADEAQAGELSGEAEIRDAVYRAFLGSCRLSDSHLKLLRRWRVSKKTAEQAGISSFSPDCVERLRAELLSAFKRSTLDRVPGFASSNGSPRLPFEALAEELIVLPYYDSSGRVKTLEGVRLAPGLTGEERYVCPEEAVRLYLPSGTQVEEIELLCSGILAALNLCEAGVKAAALRGLESPGSLSLALMGRSVGVFEGQSDSVGLSAAVEGQLGGRAVAVRLPEEVESVERWITSLPGNKERSQLFGRLIEPVRNAPARTARSPAGPSESSARPPGDEGQADKPPVATARTGEPQQERLFGKSPALDTGSDGTPAYGREGSTPEGSHDAENSEESKRIQHLPGLHGGGWLEVSYKDVAAIAKRDRRLAESAPDDQSVEEETARFGHEKERSARLSFAKQEVKLGLGVGMLGAGAGAVACTLILYALAWPLGLGASALWSVSCAVAAGMLLGVGAALGASESRAGVPAGGSVADAWSRSWSQGAFGFGASYLLLTLLHHAAHRVVYPLADRTGSDLLASGMLFIGNGLDALVPDVVVGSAGPLALLGAAAFFVRAWEVRRNGPAHTVVEVAGGHYTLPSESLMTFWEGVSAVLVFAVVGRLFYGLFGLFFAGAGGRPGVDTLQAMLDGRLLLLGLLVGAYVALYGWLGSRSRRLVERDHILGKLTDG